MPLPQYLQPLMLEVVHIGHPMGRGNSQPLFAICEDSSGATHTIVLKLREPNVPDRQRPWNKCLARDLIGSVLARAVGIQVPDYGVAVITDDFAASQMAAPWGGRLVGNVGPNFASCFVEGAVEATASIDHQRWADILNFDALVWNQDRAQNYLCVGSDLFAIDHGMVAPTWTFAQPGLPPVTRDSVWGANELALHPAPGYLQGTLTPFNLSERWSAPLIAALLQDLGNIIPDSWSDVTDRTAWREFLGARHVVADATARSLAALV